jgi:hypothetical protein
MELGGCPPWSDWLAVTAGQGWAMASGISGCPTPYLDPTVSLTVSIDGGETFRLPWQEDFGGLPGIARYGSRWVAVGALGDVLISTNGSTWECVEGSCSSLACTDEFADLDADEERWLAVGGVGLCDELKRNFGATVATSSNGEQWQIGTMASSRFRGLTVTEAGFLGVGDGWIGHSDDGVSWTIDSSPDSASLRSAADGRGRTVVVGRHGDLYVSEDGNTWLEPFLYVTADFNRVVFDGELFFALGENGTILRSDDALNWSAAAVAVDVDLWGEAAGPENRIMVGSDGVILASEDGRAWQQRRSGVAAHLRDVAWGDGRFVAVGWDEGTGRARPAVVLVSRDGSQWTRFAAPGEGLRRVRWSGDGWLAVGGERTILRTPCLGALLELGDEHLRVPLGSTAELEVRMSEVAADDVEVSVRSSEPGRVSVPHSVTITAGSDSASIPVSGNALAAGVVLRFTLPDELGGGEVTSLVSVPPPQGVPRNVTRRVTP